jgi:hypothetical protein
MAGLKQLVIIELECINIIFFVQSINEEGVESNYQNEEREGVQFPVKVKKE